MDDDRPADGPISGHAEAEVERIIGLASEHAERLHQHSEAVARRLAARQLRELGRRRDALRVVSREAEGAFTQTVETMAAAAQRLVSEARNHTVELPDWPAREVGPIEIKLSETREITIRFNRRGPKDGGR